MSLIIHSISTSKYMDMWVLFSMLQKGISARNNSPTHWPNTHKQKTNQTNKQRNMNKQTNEWMNEWINQSMNKPTETSLVCQYSCD
jgi:uncharacterized membrane-anchored protein